MWKNSQKGSIFSGFMVVLGILAALAAIAGTVYLASKDTTPPIVSNIQPVGPLTAGTTKATFYFDMTELMPCWVTDTESDVEYGMESWTPAGSKITTYRTIVEGLSDGKTYTFRIRCVHMDSDEADFTFTYVFNIMKTR